MKTQQVYLPRPLQVFNFVPMALGKQIRYHREQQGLTLEQLSERSGVDVGTISALEVRESKRSQYATRLASALGLSLEELIDGLPARIGDDATPRQLAKPRGWPFDRITPEAWKKLSDDVRTDIEDYIEMKIAKAERPLPPGRENKRAA